MISCGNLRCLGTSKCTYELNFSTTCIYLQEQHLLQLPEQYTFDYSFQKSFYHFKCYVSCKFAICLTAANVP